MTVCSAIGQCDFGLRQPQPEFAYGQAVRLHCSKLMAAASCWQRVQAVRFLLQHFHGLMLLETHYS